MSKMPDFGLLEFKRSFITMPIRMHFVGLRLRIGTDPLLCLGKAMNLESSGKLDDIETRMKKAESVLDEFEKSDMTIETLKVKLEELSFTFSTQSAPK